VKFAELRRFALGLPDVTEEPHFHYSSFRVRGKIFVTVPPPGTHIHVFVDDEERERALVVAPEAVEKLWGKRVVGVHVQLRAASAALIRQLVRNAWRRKAPKSLLNATPK
jgi:hypothetical protein